MNIIRGGALFGAQGSLPSHGEISGCAKALWSLMGKPAGRDDSIWLEAERRLNRRWTNTGGWRDSPSRWIGSLRERLLDRFPGPQPHRSETSL